MTSTKKEKLKWHRELNKYLDELGICWCERCGVTGQDLDISHGKKQRFLKTRELYFFACRLCRTCHHWAEYGTKDEPGTHERLEQIHRELIERRPNKMEKIEWN